MRKSVHQHVVALLVASGAMALVACQGTSETRQDSLQVFVSEPVGVMGTQTSLAVALPSEDSKRARDLLQSAEAELRRIEALMSTWIEESEISRLKAASAGENVSLSTDSLEVLRASRGLFDQTDGAFDVTSRPLIERWRLAGKEGVLPTDEDLARRRQESDWSQIDLLENGARKSRGSAGLAARRSLRRAGRGGRRSAGLRGWSRRSGLVGRDPKPVRSSSLGGDDAPRRRGLHQWRLRSFRGDRRAAIQ